MKAPLRFESYVRPMVWGGRQLGEVLRKPLPTDAAYGEAWEISDHPSHASVVTHGPYKGQTLRQLMEQSSSALLGESAGRHSRFPWLVKLLDAGDWLSVQVHPNDEHVVRLWPGEGGKTEAWFVLATQPNSRIYAGLLPGVDEKVLREALSRGTVGDCLHQFSPRPGDCVFLPAGTVHAVGGGVLMAEVQQTSDATFRLFDWNRRDAQGRSRQLHIEEALACIDWNSGPVHPVRPELSRQHNRAFGTSRGRFHPTTACPMPLFHAGLSSFQRAIPFQRRRPASAAGPSRPRHSEAQRGSRYVDRRRHAAVAGRSRRSDLPSRRRWDCSWPLCPRANRQNGAATVRERSSQPLPYGRGSVSLARICGGIYRSLTVAVRSPEFAALRFDNNWSCRFP